MSIQRQVRGQFANTHLMSELCQTFFSIECSKRKRILCSNSFTLQTFYRTFFFLHHKHFLCFLCHNIIHRKPSAEDCFVDVMRFSSEMSSKMKQDWEREKERQKTRFILGILTLFRRSIFFVYSRS